MRKNRIALSVQEKRTNEQESQLKFRNDMHFAENKFWNESSVCF